MDLAHTANAYKNQQILTAPPEELTLMLYNGAIRFVSESINAIEKNEVAKAHNSNLRAQAIVREFMLTLDMEYEISRQLYAMYDYVQFRLIQGNLKKNKQEMAEARGILTELRDAWAEAMKTARHSRAVAR